MKKGWYQESARHALARKGISTRRKIIPISSIKSHTITRHISDEGFEFAFKPIEDSISVEQTKDGYVAKYLAYDENAESPDEMTKNEDDNSLFLVHYHRDFDVRRNDIVTEDDARTLYQGGTIPQEKDYFIFPVDAYIHSGVNLSMSGGFHGRLPQGHEQFDVSSVGLILVSKKEFKSKASAEKAAKGLLETWNDYLGGQTFRLVKETYDKNKKQISEENATGYYGRDYALKELKIFEG